MQWRRFAKSPDPLTVAELVLRTTEYFGSAGVEPSTFRSMPFAISRAFKGVVVPRSCPPGVASPAWNRARDRAGSGHGGAAQPKL